MSDYYGTPVLDTPFNDVMEFGLVVYVDVDGTVSRRPDVDATECVYLNLDEDGQSLDDDFIDMPPGWEPLAGWTDQHGYSGPCMHPSEYVGGRLERHIRETPGYYVTMMVDGIPTDEDADTESIGWLIAYREEK